MFSSSAVRWFLKRCFRHWSILNSFLHKIWCREMISYFFPDSFLCLFFFPEFSVLSIESFICSYYFNPILIVYFLIACCFNHCNSVFWCLIGLATLYSSVSGFVKLHLSVSPSATGSHQPASEHHKCASLTSYKTVL